MQINNDAQALLAQIREYQNKIQENRIDNLQPSVTQVETPNGNFTSNLIDALGDTMKSVNDLQGASVDAQNRYQMGEDIPLTDVVMRMQKASLALEATIQIRNKVLTAYQEIMNMPV
ncbi:MAG: flagellar hook-basal body complex protein FliE [Rhodospirillaceae bacterium]|jgi:flagellar hook-basal body complex protein FliE